MPGGPGSVRGSSRINAASPSSQPSPSGGYATAVSSAKTAFTFFAFRKRKHFVVAATAAAAATAPAGAAVATAAVQAQRQRCQGRCGKEGAQTQCLGRRHPPRAAIAAAARLLITPLGWLRLCRRHHGTLPPMTPPRLRGSPELGLGSRSQEGRAAVRYKTSRLLLGTRDATHCAPLDDCRLGEAELRWLVEHADIQEQELWTASSCLIALRP